MGLMGALYRAGRERMEGSEPNAVSCDTTVVRELLAIIKTRRSEDNGHVCVRSAHPISERGAL